MYAGSVHRGEYFNFENRNELQKKENHQENGRQIDDDDVECCYYQNDSEIREIHSNEIGIKGKR